MSFVLHFQLQWTFGNSSQANIVHILVGPSKPKSQLLRANVIKVVLAEIWFERN